MALDLLFKNKTSRKSENEALSNIRINDIMTDRFSATILADYKNESSKSTYPEVDGHNVLGVLSGIFFVPDGRSVNERFYPKEFWESVLSNPEVQNRINDRVMFGTIGHEDKYVDDEDLAKGKVSHIITKLWIDDKTGMGMGEALILGTDAGRNLYMLLKAGAKIKISSRAYGDYVQGKFHEGMPIMDADSYRLEGFDVVLLPGFPQTQLSVHESTTKHNDIDNKLIIESVIKRRSETMADKKVTKKAKSESSSLESELRRSRAKAESQTITLEKKVKDLTEKLEAATKERDTWKEEGTKLLKSYNRYNALGTVKDLSAKLEKLTKYEEIAENPEEIRKSILEATDRINKGKELFSMLNEADSALDMTESAINQYLETVGTVSQARRNKIKMERALKQYTAFGTISDIAAMSEKIKATEAQLEKARMEKDCRKYSAMTGQSLETIQGIFESAKSREDAIKLITSLKPTSPMKMESMKRKPLPRATFKKESVIDSKNNKVLETKNESVSNPDIEITKSVLGRFMR
jgi:hypothetical protein